MLGQRLRTAKRKAKKIYKYYHNREFELWSNKGRELGIYRKTKVFCSSCCGNLRKSEGKTRQELIQELEEKEFFELG